MRPGKGADREKLEGRCEWHPARREESEFLKGFIKIKEGATVGGGGQQSMLCLGKELPWNPGKGKIGCEELAVSLVGCCGE